MKRSLFILLAAFLAFGTFTGCGDDEDNPGSDVTDDTSDTSEDTDGTDSTEDTDGTDGTDGTDSTEDTDGTEEDGDGTSEIKDACTTTANTQAFEEYATSSGSACQSPGDITSDKAQNECGATACLVGCTEQKKQEIAACTVTELQKVIAIDDTCGTCYANLTICGVENCPGECIDGGSDCVTCLEDNGCSGTFETCSGLSVDYTPCPAQ